MSERMTPEELAATLEQTATWMASRPAGVTWTGDGLDGTVAGLRDAARSIRGQLVPAWDALTSERDSLRELAAEILDDFERVITHADVTNLIGRDELADYRTRAGLDTP
jgi:hypothetical protein